MRTKKKKLFSNRVKSLCADQGLTISQLEKAASIPHTTMSRHLKDGEWSRSQIQAMHRVIRFSAEDMQIFLEGGE